MSSKAKPQDGPREYVWPHPRYAKVTKDKVWLEGRSKTVTGFCSPHNPVEAQGHEGTKPVSLGGQPMRVCEFYKDCPCSCHYEIDQLYAMAGKERPAPKQSEAYESAMDKVRIETEKALAWVPGIAVVGVPSSDGGTDAHPDDERPVATPPSPGYGTLQTGPHGTVEPVFTPTPTGRRARGQLEYDVLKVCADYMADVYDWPACTPKMVSEEIGKKYAIEPPSTGAINAVWDRWEKLEFAEQAKKPSRLVCFKMDPSIQTLDMLKARIKREGKRTARATRMTLPPSKGKK